MTDERCIELLRRRVAWLERRISEAEPEKTSHDIAERDALFHAITRLGGTVRQGPRPTEAFDALFSGGPLEARTEQVRERYAPRTWPVVAERGTFEMPVTASTSEGD